jgi:hypothetical protein
VSGPARGRLHSVPRPAARASVRPRMQAAASVALPQSQSQPIGGRLAEALVSLPDARWLDRLLRGRAWIALIALGLFGLVFMQVSMLGMNAGIGQAVEKSTVLDRQNADLRRQVSQLSSEERIQREAVAAGLIMPPAGDVRYLRSNGLRSDAARAARTMRAPSDQAKATSAAADAGATGVGLPAGDVAPAPAATGVAGATAPQTQTPAPVETPAPTATQETPAPAPAATQETPAPAPVETPAPTQAQTPATTQQAPVQQSAPATAAGAAVAPGNG